MNKDDLLMRIREDNEAKEPMQAEVNRLAFMLGGIGALAVAIAVYLLELFMFDKDNVAVFLVALISFSLPVTVRAIKLKGVFNIVIACFCAVMLTVVTVLYVLMLCYGKV